MTVFGSARFPEHHPYYQLARQVGRELADAGFTVMTGGGPGIMEAANRGAQEAGGFSIGCNIELPQEQERNRYLDQWVDFNHFFDRSPSHATTSKPLPHRAGPFRIMCMDSYPWIVRRAAGNSRKPCLAFTVERLVSFAPFQINRCEAVHPVQARGSSSAIPDSTTGAQSGNSATSDRVPPIASTVFRSVDNSRLLRFSSRETLSWVIPSFLAMRNLRELTGVPQFT